MGDRLKRTADRHYESLRDAVWLRVVSEDPRMPWAAFEDAYQEAWAWITARDRDGRPVVAESGSPVAYLAQVVRRWEQLLDKRLSRSDWYYHVSKIGHLKSAV